MKNGIYLFMALLGLLACKSDKEKQVRTEVGNGPIYSEGIKKIDVHSHFEYERSYLPAFLENSNTQAVLVDFFMEDSLGVVSGNWDRYLTQARKHPELFVLCSGFSGEGLDDPDFAKKTINRLKQEIAQGARMVKVWKNFGMVAKDATGSYIQIDDSRLQPIWDFLKDQQIPVMAHIGEPEQAWRPLDPNNPHYSYYKRHPEYHAYNFPEIPSYETILAARDRWIGQNPDLKILCAHFGSMSHNVDMVAQRLDKFANMYVETAARFGDLVRQDNKKVTAFFEKYQDRIMFGSDFGTYGPEESMTQEEVDAEQRNLDKNYNLLWNYLGSKEMLELGGHKTNGLGLDRKILEKVYYQNAADFLKIK